MSKIDVIASRIEQLIYDKIDDATDTFYGASCVYEKQRKAKLKFDRCVTDAGRNLIDELLFDEMDCYAEGDLFKAFKDKDFDAKSYMKS